MKDAGRIRIRVTLDAGIADILILMPHPMDNGRTKDEQGRRLPAHFIQQFSVLLNDAPLIEGELNTSIARNPLFSFKAGGIKPGDRLSVNWTDNTGAHRHAETKVP